MFQSDVKPKQTKNLSNRCTDLLQIFCGCSLGWWTATKFVKIWVLPLFFMELWVVLCNFWPILKKSSIKPLTRNHSYLIWRVPRGFCLVSGFFKLGRSDLYLRFKLTIFIKHIFDFFSQTAAQILMKFGSYMHPSKVTQVCSNQGCITYFH